MLKKLTLIILFATSISTPIEPARADNIPPPEMLSSLWTDVFWQNKVLLIDLAVTGVTIFVAAAIYFHKVQKMSRKTAARLEEGDWVGPFDFGPGVLIAPRKTALSTARVHVVSPSVSKEEVLRRLYKLGASSN